MPLFKLADFAAPSPGTSVCLGMFDGVHLGHKALIDATCTSASEKALVPCAFTFDLPPAAVFSPDKNIRLLTDIDRKSDLMHALGLHHVVYECFTRDVASIPAEDFFRTILIEKMQARHIVVGFHYHFGKNARGDADMLSDLCREYGISLTVIPPVTTPEGDLISSTAIRNHIACGQISLAEKLLGRPIVHPETL